MNGPRRARRILEGGRRLGPARANVPSPGVAPLGLAPLGLALLGLALLGATLLGVGLTAAGCAPADDGVGADGATALPAPPVGPLDALARRHGRLRDRLRELGLAEVAHLGRHFAPEGGGFELPLDLPTDRCATLVALGGSGLRDLRLTLYDGGGDEVAVDAVPAEGGLAHACPQGDREAPTRRPYHLVAQALEGSGAVVIAHFAGRPIEGRGFDGLFDGLLSPRVPFRAVEEKLARSRAALRARGLAPFGEPVFESLAEGAVTRRTLPLEADACYAVIALGDTGIVDLDIFLFDPSGAEVARDLEGDAEPRIEHCTGDGGEHTVEIRSYEGSGAVGWMTLVGPMRDERDDDDAAADDGDDPPAPDDGDPVVALAAVATALGERGYVDPVFFVRGGRLAPGESRALDVALGAGCTVVLGTAGDPGVDLDLYLSTEAGVPLDRDTRVQPTARVAACPARPGVHRVTVKSYGREGTYALAAIPAPADVTGLLDLRLEEARAGLVGRGFAPVPAGAAVAPGAERRELREGERWSWPVAVPAGWCVALAAAGDEGISDLDLLLRSPVGDLLASDAGTSPHASVARCAGDEALLLEAEAVVYRGAGAVLRVALVRDDRPTSEPPGVPAERAP